MLENAVGGGYNRSMHVVITFALLNHLDVNIGHYEFGTYFQHFKKRDKCQKYIGLLCTRVREEPLIYVRT